jgi:hypothetical protein
MLPEPRPTTLGLIDTQPSSCAASTGLYSSHQNGRSTGTCPALPPDPPPPVPLELVPPALVPPSSAPPELVPPEPPELVPPELVPPEPPELVPPELVPPEPPELAPLFPALEASSSLLSLEPQPAATSAAPSTTAARETRAPLPTFIEATVPTNTPDKKGGSTRIQVAPALRASCSEVAWMCEEVRSVGEPGAPRTPTAVVLDRLLVASDLDARPTRWGADAAARVAANVPGRADG